MTDKKIGCAILTCNRYSYVQKLLSTIDIEKVHELVIVDDSGIENKNNNNMFDGVECIRNKKNLGIGKSKNKALKHLLQKNCTDLFLLEDDIYIKDNSVFERYINASRVSGIQHFNFAFHGNDNYSPDGTPAVRLRLDYNDTISVSLYPNVYGAFSYYTKMCLYVAGFMDEFYYNAMEHVDHTNEIINHGMHPQFRWFADITNSQNYICEIDKSHAGSEIRKDQNWIKNFHSAADYFAKKHGFDVRDSGVYIASKDEVVSTLKQIKKNYGRKSKI